MKIVLLLVCCLYGAVTLSAQPIFRTGNASLDSIARILERYYVFPDKAAAMSNYLKQRAGLYDTFTNGSRLAEQLTLDLRKICKDQHLKINYEEQAPPVRAQTAPAPGSRGNWLNNLLTENNYGIKEKKILPGNIGYLNIPMFGPLNRCADTLVAAMKYVAQTDALILDLRSSRGSLDENAVPFLCSYFFPEPVHMFDFYTRHNETIRQFWTYAVVPGTLYLNKPVYILTSGRTFSGGEELSYDLQQLKRAKIVGETTRGGANPTDLIRADSRFTISVPVSRVINAVTRTNWEQVGVKPDVEVKSNLALYTVQELLLDSLLRSPVSSAQQKEQLRQILSNHRSSKPVLRLMEFNLPGYTQATEVYLSGSFNNWAPHTTAMKRSNQGWTVSIEAEPGELTYKFVVDGKWLLDPLNTNVKKENGSNNSLVLVK
ncbi:MAG TPA: S41 family peptidase [Sediminibacterium sp.]|nr:S41 family peptidase [Sediminibacterium sp.]